MQEAIVATGIWVFNQWRTEEATEEVIEYKSLYDGMDVQNEFSDVEILQVFHLVFFLVCSAQLNLQAELGRAECKMHMVLTNEDESMVTNCVNVKSVMWAT